MFDTYAEYWLAEDTLFVFSNTIMSLNYAINFILYCTECNKIICTVFQKKCHISFENEYFYKIQKTNRTATVLRFSWLLIVFKMFTFKGDIMFFISETPYR